MDCFAKKEKLDCQKQAWMACQIVPVVGDAIEAYKTKFCKLDYNAERTGEIKYPLERDPLGAPIVHAIDMLTGVKDEFLAEDRTFAGHLAQQGGSNSRGGGGIILSGVKLRGGLAAPAAAQLGQPATL